MQTSQVDSDSSKKVERRKKDSARLVWDTKPRRAPNPKDLEFQTAEIVIPNPSRDQTLLSPFLSELSKTTIDPVKMNRLIWGDNLLAMQVLLASGYEGEIDLVYIDPPFWTGENYYSNIRIGGEEVTKSPSVIERLAYKDIWEGGIDSYLDMMFSRLQLMKRLLAGNGSIFVHSDWHVAHYVKILLDEVFGRDRLVNEIVWKRRGGHANITKQLGNVTDLIFWYSRSEDYEFKPVYSKKGTENFIKKRFAFSDSDGRVFMKAPLNNPAPRPTLQYEYKGYKPPRNGWAISREKMEEWDRAGKLFFPEDKSQRINRKIYLDEWKGHPVQNLWSDISTINSMSNERCGFPTQKPLELINRIIELSANVGDLLFDPFCGSGTSLVAAEGKGLKWIGCDFSKTALQMARNRLVQSDARPFLIQNIGNYQRHMVYLSGGKIYEMQHIVLKLYGATPRKDLPELGLRKTDEGGTELVYVSYPDRPMTAKKADELAEQAESLDGTGYETLVILGWDYEYDYEELLARRRASSIKSKVKIRSRTIPPEVYEYLKTHKSPDDIESFAGKVVFHDKPYLKLAKPELEASNDRTKVTVGIERYVIFDLPFEDERQKNEIQEIAKKSFAALLDYWAVDWNYDGLMFRSTWQAFRGFGKDVGQVPVKASHEVSGGRKYTIAIRAVDLLGNDATATCIADLR